MCDVEGMLFVSVSRKVKCEVSRWPASVGHEFQGKDTLCTLEQQNRSSNSYIYTHTQHIWKVSLVDRSAARWFEFPILSCLKNLTDTITRSSSQLQYARAVGKLSCPGSFERCSAPAWKHCLLLSPSSLMPAISTQQSNKTTSATCINRSTSSTWSSSRTASPTSSKTLTHYTSSRKLSRAFAGVLMRGRYSGMPLNC